MGANKELVCEDCGEQDNTVSETTCPYAAEIYSEYKEVTLCDGCYNRRWGEI